jgi:hypothetical protein
LVTKTCAICHQESQKLVKIKQRLVWLVWMIFIYGR